MSVRNHLALILAAVLLPLLVGTGIVIGIIVPRGVDKSLSQELQLAAQAGATVQSLLCGQVGDAARIMALSVAKGEAPQKAVSDGVDGRTTFGAVLRGSSVLHSSPQVPAGVDVTRIPAQRCSAPPAPVATAKVAATPLPRTVSTSGPPSAVDYVSVATSNGTVTAVAAFPFTAAALNGWRSSLHAADRLEFAMACPGGASATTASGPLAAELLSAARATITGQALPASAQGAVEVAKGDAGHPCAIVAAAQDPTATRDAAMVTWMALVLCLVVGAAFVWWLARQLTLPLQALTQATARAAEGDLAVRLPVQRTDEVGQLASTFNHMAEQLDLRMNEVRSSRDQLRESTQRLGEALQRTHDLDGLLSTLCAIAATISSSQRVTAWLLEGGTLVARVGWPKDAVRTGRLRVSVIGSLPGRALSAGAPRSVESSEGESATQTGGPALAMPLHRGELPLGAVIVEREAGSPPYTDRDEATLLSITGPAGIAVHNALLHREAQRLAVIDPLTGVGNMRQLTTTLAREVDRARLFGRSVSLLIIDIDHFKEVNDGHGHGAGDAVLHAVASRIADNVRSVDSVARYGGEEFAVICPELEPAEAFETATRLWRTLRDTPYDVPGGRQVLVRFSIGVASWPNQAAGSTDLLQAADRAVAQAKKGGRDQVATYAGTRG